MDVTQPVTATIDVVVELYTNDYTEIYKADVRIGQMEVQNGIRQGCTGSPLAPQLLVLIVNTIIRAITASTLGLLVGYRDNEFYIRALYFADDGLLLANSLKQPEQLFLVMKRAAGECGLEINTLKSNCMIFNSVEIRFHISKISNSVTHLRSYTNSAYPRYRRKPSPVTPRDRRRRRAERRRLRRLRIERRHLRIERRYRRIE